MSPRAQKRCTGARRLLMIGMFFGCFSSLTAWSQLRDRIFVHPLQDFVRKRRVAVWIGTVVRPPNLPALVLTTIAPPNRNKGTAARPTLEA